jgi:hypothetical protein
MGFVAVSGRKAWLPDVQPCHWRSGVSAAQSVIKSEMKARAHSSPKCNGMDDGEPVVLITTLE